MGAVSREVSAKLARIDGRRFVEIPEELFLEGVDIMIRQERDGVITIHPAENAAREAMWARFNPFVEWENGTWPEDLPEEVAES